VDPDPDFHLNDYPDPAFNYNANPDLAFHYMRIRIQFFTNYKVNPDPAFHYNADPDPPLHYNANPDPPFHFNADPDQASLQRGWNLRPLFGPPGLLFDPPGQHCKRPRTPHDSILSL
jgi:hypothetical protein